MRGSSLFINTTKIYKFKAKDSEIKKHLVCLGNISGDFSGNNMKETESNGCAYCFFVDINIINIHKNLMKKHNAKKYLG